MRKNKLRPLAIRLALVLGATFPLVGCDRNMSLAEIEAKERASRLYTNAMEDLQAGRTEPAIRGFEHVLVQEPGNYSAHFQLATLLQDIKKDYIGAISHYRSYLLFRPASDKATVASDRMHICDTLLSAEYLRKAGGRATDKLTSENAKLEDECRKLTMQVKRLEEQLAAAQSQVTSLTTANKRYQRQIAAIGAEEEGRTAPRTGTSAKEALAEFRAMEAEQQRRRLRPTDAELLDDDSPPESRVNLAAEAKKLKAALDREEQASDRKANAAKPVTGTAVATTTKKDKEKGPDGNSAFDSFWGKKSQQKAEGSRPETYVVQPGDTLFKISTRFYGSANKWRAIREANKATIPLDGRLHVGQEIRLP